MINFEFLTEIYVPTKNGSDNYIKHITEKRLKFIFIYILKNHFFSLVLSLNCMGQFSSNSLGVAHWEAYNMVSTKFTT